jgi:aspartate-semialdehyde dehydrogenase
MPEVIRAGILGATGAVGQRFVQALEDHPWFEITCLAASDKSAGKKYGKTANWRLESKMPDCVTDMEIMPVDPRKVDADVVFSALPSSLAKTVEAEFAKEGFAVASNASAYRMEKDIPLVVPEVNADHLGLIDVQQETRGWDGYIVTNPNCSTIIMVPTLKPLMQFGLQSVHVATMQAISGAGYDGVASMAILDNVIPYIGGEEEKMESEPLKLLGEFDGSEVIPADIKISASCNRVPVMDGHTEAIWAKMTDNPTPGQVRQAFLDFRPKLGDLPTEPDQVLIVRDEQDRPQPRLDRNMGKGMSITVGRIREGIRYMAMGHNTVRGAAGASVLNAELLHKMGKL